jgi:putative membrane-bound dehydrogenase-like protein
MAFAEPSYSLVGSFPRMIASAWGRGHHPAGSGARFRVASLEGVAVMLHFQVRLLPLFLVAVALEAGGFGTAFAAAATPDPQTVRAATQVASGFVMELVAAEPAVVDPVAITFDEHGTPYVAEYRDYPLGPPAGIPSLSRIVRLDDADGDGRYEGSTVVADDIPFCQGVLAVQGGLLVTAAPDLLLLKDVDGDGRADSREVVATGFKVGNPQLRAACPQLGIDNLVSITGGLSGGVVRRPSDPESAGITITRRDVLIDLRSGRIEAATGFGQFGNAFDDLGHRFTTSNRNPLITIRLPAWALGRNTLVDLGPGYEDAAPSGAASRVFPIAATRATAASHTGTHTSACGMTIFGGDCLGADMSGQAFICEPVSHLVTRRRVVPHGASFGSERVDAEGQEFLRSTSPWFRPVFTATGPDGCLWVVDMCRSTIEHPQYMPPGLAETLDLRAGDGAGRIWRIRKEDMVARPWSRPETAAAAAERWADGNRWRRETAQRLLVEGRFPDAEAAVRTALRSSAGDLPRPQLHALWTLFGIDRLTAEDLRLAARSSAPALREAAARLALERVLNADRDAARASQRQVCQEEAVELAGTLSSDPDAGVRFAAVLAAAACEHDEAVVVLRDVIEAEPFDPWIGRAVVAGATDRAGMLIAALAAGEAGGLAERMETAPATSEAISFLQQLAMTAVGRPVKQGSPVLSDDTARVLDALAKRAAAGRAESFDLAIVSGFAEKLPAELLLGHAAGRPVVVATAASAQQKATDVAAAEPLRFAAVTVLGWLAGQHRAGGPDEPIRDALVSTARATLVSLVGNRQPAAIQAAAIKAVVRGNAADSIAAVIEELSTYEPTVRAAAVEALLARTTTIRPLLAAIEAGSVAPAVVRLERRASLIKSQDATVREAAQRIWGTAGEGSLSADDFARFLAVARQGGDMAEGRSVFLRACSTCHEVAGAGCAVGPALAEAGDRPIEVILTAIVDPNRAVEPRWEATVILTDDGELIEGIVVESNRDAVVLVRPGGERRSVPRSEIDAFHAVGRSLMPEGFGKLLKPQECADLIAFLRSGRPVPAPRE